MSRTYRKRRESFESHYAISLGEGWFKDYEIPQHKARYYSKTEKWYSYSVPRWHRNSVNKLRRRYDKHEIWKALNQEDYPEQCSRWNCKDARHRNYW